MNKNVILRCTHMAANTAGFDDIGIVSWLGRHISAVGFKEPTEVQKQCIPPILAGEGFVYSKNITVYYVEVFE